MTKSGLLRQQKLKETKCFKTNIFCCSSQKYHQKSEVTLLAESMIFQRIYLVDQIIFQSDFKKILRLEVLLLILLGMLSDDENLLDIQISQYYIHVSHPERILQVSEENRSSDSLSIHASMPKVFLRDDSLDGDRLDFNIKNVDSRIEENSLEIINNMHPQLRQFLKVNFGQMELKYIPVQLFTKYLIKEFQMMLNHGDLKMIEIKLLEYLKSIMGGNLIDVEKLVSITKENGLLGLMSVFMNSFENSNPSSKSPSEILDTQSILKSFADKLFFSLEKDVESKFNQLLSRITEKYNQTITLLYKAGKKNETKQNKKQKDQISSLKEKIIVLQRELKKSSNETNLIKDINAKLNEQNFNLHKKFQKLNEELRNQNYQASRLQSLPFLLPSPVNTSFDKSRLDQMFLACCNTPKSQKSQLTLIPEIRGRSKSSANLLDINNTFVSARQRENPQQYNHHKRLNTQQVSRNDNSVQRNKSVLKKNMQIICPKARPILQQNNKKKEWKM